MILKYDPVREEFRMPRQKSLVTVIREMVRQEVRQEVNSMMSGLLGKQAKTGRRGPGRPPGSKNKPKS